MLRSNRLRLFAPIACAAMALCGLFVAPATAATVFVDRPELTRTLNDFNDGLNLPGLSGGDFVGAASEAGGLLTVTTSAGSSDPQILLNNTVAPPFQTEEFTNLRIRQRGTVAGPMDFFPQPAAGATRVAFTGTTAFTEKQGTFPNTDATNRLGFRLDPINNGAGTFDFDYVMIDKVPTIGLAEFDAAGDSQGWTTNQISGVSVASGLLSGSDDNAGPTDPKVIQGDLAAIGLTPDLSVFNVVEVRLQLPSDVVGDAAGVFEFFWGTDLTPGFAGTRRVGIDAADVPLDGAFHTYVIDMKDVVGWDGTLTSFRFDPIRANADAGKSFALDYIRLRALDTSVPEPTTAGLLALCGAALLRRRRVACEA